MSTVLPPPSKRQKRETLARTQTQQDVTAIAPGLEGSFKARFVDGDGQQLAEVIEVPLADASEKNLTLLLNTLQGKARQEREEFLPYKFRIHIPDTDIVVDQYPTNLLELLRSHGVANPFETTVTLSAEPQAVFKDATVRIWVVNTGRTEHVLSGHKSSVSCVKWGGTGLIYTGSHDKTVKVWDAVKGTLVHTLSSHAHWVNHLALSTEFALRTGFFDHTPTPDGEEARRAKAKERFEKAAKLQGKVAERLVSASDDFTMYLWDPSQGTKPVARMLGHQKQVNHVTFSPDGTLIASAGWDNHTKIWSARDGKFINTLRGHVAPVYQCAFSADSRLLVTASKDTTLKVWSMATCKLQVDLPGHQDEVYAVDWSPRDGMRVGSGGKDKAVRLWCH
ncbi:WD repeat-containing protein [Colletotrichum tofieldiae]|nr:WD repeat-containing protein [Colletotrichum tofieldiae]